MINISYKIPRSVTLAFSGGVDSVAVADFLKRSHNLTLLFVNHRTENSLKALDFVQDFAEINGLPIKIRDISEEKPERESKEEFWRNQRYNIFHRQQEPVITCHHLDDCVETWVWSSLHGRGKLIPATNLNVIRPFLTTTKDEFISWCSRKGLEWCEDTSNSDTSYIRNHIRHNMMPDILKVNPGIRKTIRKLIDAEQRSNTCNNYNP